MRLRPLILFTLAFVAGILAAASLPGLVWIGLAALIGMSGLLLITRRAVWLPYALYTAAALIGGLDYSLHVRVPENDVGQFAPRTVTLTGVVVSDVESVLRGADAGPVGARFTLEATRIAISSAAAPAQETSGKVEVRLLFSREDRNTPVSQKTPRYGDQLSLRGRLERPSGARNPGGFDERAYLARNGIYATLSAARPEEARITRETGRSGSPILILAYTLRHAVLRHAASSFAPERAAVLCGILLGDRTNLPAGLREDLERTGTTHILATAGLHVGLVTALLLGLFRSLRLTPRPALLLTCLCLALYIPMSGERIAMTRAAIMALVYLGGRALEREPYLPNTLALSALILLVGSPQSLFEAGFQLSFAIVLTVAAVLPLLQRLRRALPVEEAPTGPAGAVRKALADLVLVALAAQIGALPLVAYYFHLVPVVGVAANLLVVPLVLPILSLGFATATLGSIAPLLAVPLDRILDYLLACLIAVTHRLAAPDWACLPVGEFSPLMVVAAYAALWGGAWLLARRIDGRRSRAEG